MASSFGVAVGYSDHTDVCGADCAVAMGAIVIEKHLTLDRSMHGLDQKALNPISFAPW